MQHQEITNTSDNKTKNQLPIVAITMGDPAGIGPEIIVKALQHAELYQCCRPLVCGEMQILRRISSELAYNVLGSPDEGRYQHGTIDVLEIPAIRDGTITVGRVDAQCGMAAYSYLTRAVELAMEGRVASIATAPMNKEALRAAAVPSIGHTEILADLCKVNDPLTMFQVAGLRVFFMSRHVSLRDACDLVTRDRVLHYIRRCSRALEELGIVDASLVVAGLNPHCGENGLFGDEEVEHIMPAIQAAREEGYRVEGPVAADSVFHQALQGRYTAVLSLYHDQGHIATKMVDFERTISLTLQLPFLRTSVDHGTAFDIAGRNRASELSMLEAIRIAGQYV